MIFNIILDTLGCLRAHTTINRVLYFISLSFHSFYSLLLLATDFCPFLFPEKRFLSDLPHLFTASFSWTFLFKELYLKIDELRCSGL